MNPSQRRTKVRHSAATSSSVNRTFEREHTIPIPSRQGELNERTDFTLDPSLIFDDLPQPFRFV